MDKHYTAEKINMAMHCLAVEDKLLRERVAEAHSYLLRVSCREGFEHDFAVIEECLATVKQGDYSGVTQQQLATVVNTVMEMFRRLAEVSR